MNDPKRQVAISRGEAVYPVEFPYDAETRYPEYRGQAGQVQNPAYRGVRKSLELLGYDADHFGTAEWNPLGHLIRPGDCVFIKPNLVTHEYGRKKERLTGDVFSVITHPSVVRAVADYAAIALKGKGQLIIGDNPSIDADFSRLMELTRLDRFSEYYKRVYGLECRVLDLREKWCDDLRNYGVESKMKPLAGDPKGDVIVNLGETSFFQGINSLLFRGVYDNRWDTIRHHHGSKHEYSISRSIYEADVYISIPKLKTHHKVGATLNIKGLVGACSKKNYLVHWRIGFPEWGGDEYGAAQRPLDPLRLFLRHLAGNMVPQTVRGWFKGGRLEGMFQAPGYRGAWEGNDTCWRMAADLYQALRTRDRKYFSVIDGIVAGEGNGPFCPTAKPAGVIIAGEDLVATDCAAVRLMGFDAAVVKYLPALLDRFKIEASRIDIVSRDFTVEGFWGQSESRYLDFQPPSHWDHLKRKGAGA